jgi:hypothetical protein
MSLATMQGLLGGSSVSGVQHVWRAAAAEPGRSSALPPALCAHRRRRRKSSANVEDDASFAMRAARALLGLVRARAGGLNFSARGSGVGRIEKVVAGAGFNWTL